MIQPANAGIIKNLKSHLEFLPDWKKQSNPSSNDMASKVTVLDAIHVLARSWRWVKEMTTMICFQKAFHTSEKEIDPLKHVPPPPNIELYKFEALVDEDLNLEPDQDTGEEEGWSCRGTRPEFGRRPTTNVCLTLR